MYRNVLGTEGRDCLILQGNHGLIIQTKGSYSLQPALGLGYDTYRTVTVDGVAIFSQVPASALVGLLLPMGLVHRSA
jgi:hypothetical protein